MSIEHLREQIAEALNRGDLDERINVMNELREAIAEHSPFSSQPVDFVRWVKADRVHANDYNPNVVAPPEMELLRVSIAHDGYTQPIVTMDDSEGEGIEVIDGFHRHRVGKECADVQKLVHGYLPVVTIRASQADRNDRIASTIRHNRARGKHRIDAMSEIVVELKRRNWSEDRIGRELGMDADEVLRLCQITGLAELFSDEDFSRAWDVATDDEPTAEDFEELVEQ
jgi:ParB-like chromosome segregation protein Spo0J